MEESKVVAEMLDELQRINTEEQKLLKQKDELIKKIKTAPKEAWDWISVKEAAFIMGRSPAFIYARVNAGTLETRHHGSCVMIRKSQVLGIDDKYQQDKVEA